MHSLKLKIPPIIVVLIIGLLMYSLNFLSLSLSLKLPYTGLLTITILICACAFILAGGYYFKKAKTTVNPMQPNQTSSLVDSGIYNYSRNPMYVGFYLFLLAWAVFLNNAFALLLSFGFILYMNHFQIKPEEQALESLFAQDYLTYKQKVRRWL